MGKRGKKRTEHRTRNGIEEKFCYKCMKWHPLDSFGSHKNAWDVFYRWITVNVCKF